jgi:DNA mismatch repair protein MutS2
MDIKNKSIKSLEFDKVLEKLANFAKLKQSKSECLGLEVYSDVGMVQTQIKFTREALDILDVPLDLPLEYVASVDNIKASTLNSYLSPEELVDVAKTIKTSRLVRNFLKENSPQESLLNSLAYGLFSDKALEDMIFDTFDSNLSVKSGATSELKSLNAALKDTEKNLKVRVNELLNDSGFSKHLQENIYTTRDDRVVFQVRASSKSKVAGIMHDVSASSQSFYIEPSQVVPLNNKLRELKAKILAEIIKILTELTRLVKENIDDIKNSEALLTQLDVHFAKARYAINIKAIEPELLGERYVKFDSMRHPLLIGVVDSIVENDFEIGREYKSVVITGSNTGGKTVTIKTVGLFILMAKAGLFLPCLEAKLYPFQDVFADIGDEQSIAQSLSTFSSHMTNIIDIVNKSNEDSFVVIDEMCAGTDPQEGAILAQVVLERLAENGVLNCVTTHYGELKALEFSNEYFKNASIEFDTQSLKPTYRLVIGIPGLSNAISISSNLGLDQSLVEKSKEILVSQKDPSSVVVEKLQETQLELSENLKQAEDLKESSEVTQKELDKKLNQLKKDKNRTVKHIKTRFEGEIESAKDEIKEILKEMRQEKSEKIARRSYSRIATLEKRLRDDLNGFNEREKYQELDWEKVKSGDKVLLKDLNQEVEILGTPDKSGNVFVQLGLIKTKIKKNKLAMFDSKLTKKVNLRFKKQESFEVQRREMSNKLDLRGYRVEEALDSLEEFLDKASLINLSPVYVVHGHGTGALKSAVGDFVANSPYVAKYRYGESSEGSDGVTVIDIA